MPRSPLWQSHNRQRSKPDKVTDRLSVVYVRSTATTAAAVSAAVCSVMRCDGVCLCIDHSSAGKLYFASSTTTTTKGTTRRPHTEWLQTRPLRRESSCPCWLSPFCLQTASSEYYASACLPCSQLIISVMRCRLPQPHQAPPSTAVGVTASVRAEKVAATL